MWTGYQWSLLRWSLLTFAWKGDRLLCWSWGGLTIAGETIAVEMIAVNFCMKGDHVLCLCGGGGGNQQLLLRRSLLRPSRVNFHMKRQSPHVLIWGGGGSMITVEGIDSQLSLVHETERLFMFTPHLMIFTLLLQYEWHNLYILCNLSTSMWEMSCVHMSINVHIHMSSFQCDACLHVISMFKRISGTKLKSLVDRGQFCF